MDNTLTIVINASMVVLTIVMYTMVLVELRKAMALAGWTPERQKKSYNKVFITFVGWGVFTAALALSGFLHHFSGFPPRLMVVLIIPLITLIVVSLSSAARELLLHVPTKTLLRFQAFRVFVEILLWMAFLQNLMPIQTTFEGRNFDILVGITGPIMAIWFSSKRSLVIAWNIISLGILLNIVVIAVLSLPTPFRVFMDGPSTEIVTTFPFVWLPAFLVPLAYGLHFLSLRQMVLAKRQDSIKVVAK